MERLRILIADDHPQILALLQTLLEPDYHVVGAVQDGQALVAAALALRPDVVLTDVDMPILNGIDATRELHRSLPDCRVIFYTGYAEPEIMAAAFAAGASGYLIKKSSQSLISSIRTVVRHVWNGEAESGEEHVRHARMDCPLGTERNTIPVVPAESKTARGRRFV